MALFWQEEQDGQIHGLAESLVREEDQVQTLAALEVPAFRPGESVDEYLDRHLGGGVRVAGERARREEMVVRLAVMSKAMSKPRSHTTPHGECTGTSMPFSLKQNFAWAVTYSLSINPSDPGSKGNGVPHGVLLCGEDLRTAEGMVGLSTAPGQGPGRLE